MSSEIADTKQEFCIMAVLEKVTQMKKRGLSDEQIIQKLRDERVSPREIRDAMNQSQIKNAVSMEDEMQPSVMPPSPEGEAPMPSQELSQPQRASQPVQPEYSPGSYIPKTREIPEEEVYAPSPQEYYSPQQSQQYQPEEYQQGYSQPYQEAAVSTDTIIEISQQVFSESMKSIQKKIDEFNEFKTLTQAKVDNAIERLKRIEAVIDKLQISILERIGTYGKSLDEIKKEMSMMQDSFGKIVNPLVDQSEENFSRKRPKKSVEDLFPEEEKQAEEQNVQEESFQEQPRKIKKTSKK
jgi:hypothetical protein